MSELIAKIAALPTRPRFSDSGNWCKCPAKLTYPSKDSTNQAAQMGTLGHEVGEASLRFGIPVSSLRSKIATMTADEDEIDEMVAHIQAYVDYVEKFDGEQYLELNVALPELGIDGTADCVVWNSVTEELHIIDLKYGKMHVEVAENSQLMTYAVAAANQLKVSPKLTYLHVFQPRTGNVNQWAAAKPRLQVHYYSLVAALQDACGDNPSHNPDPDAQCKWCPAKANCSALKALNTRIVKAALIGNKGDRDARQEILSNAPLVRLFLDAVEAEEIADLEGGAEPMRFKLVPRRPTKKWKVDDISIEAKLGKNVYAKPKVLSPPQMLKAFPDKKDVIEELYESVSSGNNLKEINKSEK